MEQPIKNLTIIKSKEKKTKNKLVNLGHTLIHYCIGIHRVVTKLIVSCSFLEDSTQLSSWIYDNGALSEFNSVFYNHTTLPVKQEMEKHVVQYIYIFQNCECFVSLFCFFTSQSTVFQSCLKGFSWVEQVLSRGHNTVPLVRFEPTAPKSRVKHSNTESPCSSIMNASCQPKGSRKSVQTQII